MNDQIEEHKRLSIWYLVPLILTFILILPPILSLPPFWPKDSINQPGIFAWLIVLPFYLGLVSAPGYLYAWSGFHSGRKVKGWKKSWIELSLALGILCSFIGGLLSIMTVIVAPFAFWSFVMVVKLFWRFRTT